MTWEKRQERGKKDAVWNRQKGFPVSLREGEVNRLKWTKEDEMIDRLMREVLNFDKTRLNPREYGWDCTGCRYYLGELHRCRFSECRVRKEGQGGAGR